MEWQNTAGGGGAWLPEVLRMVVSAAVAGTLQAQPLQRPQQPAWDEPKLQLRPSCAPRLRPSSAPQPLTLTMAETPREREPLPLPQARATPEVVRPPGRWTLSRSRSPSWRGSTAAEEAVPAAAPPAAETPVTRLPRWQRPRARPEEAEAPAVASGRAESLPRVVRTPPRRPRRARRRSPSSPSPLREARRMREERRAAKTTKMD